MKKPNKAWQISLDFIRSSNKIYFLELNNNSSIIMCPSVKDPIFKIDSEHELARGIGNTEYATKNYVKYLVTLDQLKRFLFLLHPQMIIMIRAVQKFYIKQVNMQK